MKGKRKETSTQRQHRQRVEYYARLAEPKYQPVLQFQTYRLRGFTTDGTLVFTKWFYTSEAMWLWKWMEDQDPKTNATRWYGRAMAQWGQCSDGSIQQCLDGMEV